MGIELITTEAVRDALRGLRYAKRLTSNPLLGMDCLTLRLREEGLAESPPTRSWVLGLLLRETVEAALESARHAPAPAAGAQADLRQLRDDFATGRQDLEALALVWYRYLVDDPLPVGELATEIGVVYRTLARRLETGHVIVADRLRQSERAAWTALGERPGAPPHERVTVVANRASEVPDPASALKRALLDEAAVAQLSPDEARRVAELAVGDEDTYLLTRVARWMGPEHRLDARFVALGLVVDRGEDMPAGRWQVEEEKYSDLSALLDARPDPLVVVLGPPGSGKTTLIRHLELQVAARSLRQTGPLPFLLPLNLFTAQHGGNPLAWMAGRWGEDCPHLRGLEQIASDRGVLLLLDGLNEIPHNDFNEYRGVVIGWKRALHQFVETHPRSRVLVTCRTLDYSAPLSTSDLRVPHISIEPLTDSQIQAFLLALGRGDVWRSLEDSPQIEALRNPFNVRLFVDQLEFSDGTVLGRAALVTGFVREALARELRRDNPLFLNRDLVTERDYRRAVGARAWRTAWDLPEQGALFRALSDLATAAQRAGGLAGQLRIPYDWAVAAMGDDVGPDVIKAAAAMALIDEDLGRDEVMFAHQLLQEYFAARRLATEPDPKLVQRPWRAADMTPGAAVEIASLPIGESMPPLPTTGWEEVAVMAAEMAPSVDAHIAGLAEANLALAGACAAAPGTFPSVSAAVRAEIAGRLAARSSDASADIRDRIACARALGRFGDPRLRRHVATGGTCLVGDLVSVEAGTYPIGSDHPIDAPGPRADSCVPGHAVTVGAFQIGRHPVTNGEFALFIAGEGYEAPELWDTAAAALWRHGIGTAEAARDNNRYWRARFIAEPDVMRHFEATGTFDKTTSDRWSRWRDLADDRFEAELAIKWPEAPVREPRFWKDPRFNHPVQPVVGITWYEARAYSAWLAAVTDLPYRLPTEAEREIAASGAGGRAYAYGERFNPLAGNTMPTRLRSLAPVGVFPEGDTPEGAADLAGNTSDWTSSAWGTQDDAPVFAYPYDATDGREEADSTSQMRRVLRGGSWNSEAFYCLAAIRHYLHPAAWDYDNGVRVALSG